jgi:hypothetical protein
MKATYFAPGAVPKTYDCEPGEKPGTVDLLNAKGRVIVLGAKVIGAEDARLTGGCVVMVAAEKSSKPKAPKVEKEKKSTLAPDSSTPESLDY